jgi:hypothetical protein
MLLLISRLSYSYSLLKLSHFQTFTLSSSAVQQFQKKAVLLQGGCFEKRTTTVSKPGSAD